MRTRILGSLVAAVAIIWLGHTFAWADDAKPNPTVLKASATDYSVVLGTAFASDAEQSAGVALAIDPAWVAQQKEPPQLQMVAQDKTSGNDPNAPPVPPAETSDNNSATGSSSTNKSNDKTDTQHGATGQSCDSCTNGSCSGGTCSSGTCTSGTCTSGSCTSGSCTSTSCTSGNCDGGDCGGCDDSCHHCRCTDPIQYCGGPIQFSDHCWPSNCCDDEPGHVFDCCLCRQNNVGIYGWLDGGIVGNDHAPTSHFNGPVTFPDRDDGQLNQFYGVLERTAACDNCGWFIGGRVDMYWGSDYFFTTAAGLDGRPNGNTARWNSTDSFLYGWSMPQMYAEVDYNDIKVKLGHFYSPIGYEVAPAVGNFFYTHSYARQYGEPITSTGVLASQPLNDNWTWYAGIDNGWNAFDCDSRANFIGGVSFHDDCWGSLGFMIQTGDDSVLDLPGVGPFANRTTYSLVWQRDISSKLTYVLEHNLGIQQDAATIQGIDTAEWYGLTNYLFYKINCCWEVGARFEWFRDDDGFAVTGLRPGNPLAGNFFAGNFYETSLGLNWKPNSNIVVRPEVRWDWFNGASTGGPPYNDNTSRNQFLFGLDAIVQF